MKPKLRALLIGIIVVACGYVAYSKRLQLAAIGWHWKNGDFTQVGSYQVPVPARWLVKVDSSGVTLLTDTVFNRDGPLLSKINVITIESMPVPTRDLDFWKSNKQKGLKENGVSITEQRSLSFADESMECLGGHEFHEGMLLASSDEIVSLDCMSSGRLHFMFVGQQPDLQVVYAIIPKVRK
jgi:hypothetical protein